jgi:hypothetical protein
MGDADKLFCDGVCGLCGDHGLFPIESASGSEYGELGACCVGWGDFIECGYVLVAWEEAFYAAGGFC